MSRGRCVMACVMAATVMAGAMVRADVKTQEKSQIKFEGVLGRMFGLFGGKAAKEGVVNTVAVKGNRKIRVSDTAGEIIDLAEQKVYTLDMRAKTYKVATFDEIRKQMEEQARKAQEEMRKSEGRKETADQPQKQMEVDFSAKETGKTQTVNGFSCREVVTTITVHEKGKTLEQAGGIVLTADSWLAPKIPAMNEIVEFDLKYWKMLQTPAMADAAQQMAQALAMYPGLGQAMTKMQTENVNMNGTPILTTTRMENVSSSEQAAKSEKQEQDSPSAGIGGLLGKFGRKKTDDSSAAGGTSTPGRTAIMTTVTEVLSVAPAVSEAELAMPAGFKQK
jgi:hypothetical protein